MYNLSNTTIVFDLDDTLMMTMPAHQLGAKTVHITNGNKTGELFSFVDLTFGNVADFANTLADKNNRDGA